MKKAIIIILGILMIGLVSAITLEMNLGLSQDKINVLKEVGKGIGTVEKFRMLFDENGTNYANETYIDELKLINQDCDGDYCHFKLYEEGGINKDFKIKLEKICSKQSIDEFGESYCSEYRQETDEEILIKADIKAKEILNKIVDVTIDRQTRTKVKRFEDVEITI